MPLRGYSDYSDVNWFVRALRAVPVIAGAALLGGLIGGFAVFAVDSALTWEPASQAQPEARAENHASAQPNTAEQHATKPVRVVGGAIPDPSAGMSGPPPSPQPQPQPQPQSKPQRSSTAAQPQISSQPVSSQPVSSQPVSSQPVSSELLAPKPLGPATQLQPQAATASSVTPTQNQPVNQTDQSSLQTHGATSAQQQPTRWPDALSRAHQKASNAPDALQQTTPPPAAPTIATNKNAETDRKEPDSNRAATAYTQNGATNQRQVNRNRRQPVFSANGGRNGNETDAATAPASRRQAARSYDRLYDSYGNQRQQSYANRREPFHGEARGGDQDDTGYRSDPRRYGRDAGSRPRSRVITRDQPSDQMLDERLQRAEPFWGGGFFGRGQGYYSDDY